MFSFFLGAADLVISVSHFASRSSSHAPHAFAAQLLGNSLKMLHRSILPVFSRRTLGRRLRRCSISGAAANTNSVHLESCPFFPSSSFRTQRNNPKNKGFPTKNHLFSIFFSSVFLFFSLLRLL